MKITIIAVGKLKEKYWTEAIKEYTMRLSKYCKLDIIELADEKAPEKMSLAQEEEVKVKEGERILKNIGKNCYTIALAIEGKQKSSTELAEHITQLGVKGNGHLCFIIGGSLGLSEQVLKAVDEKLSFSKMTFPHQLMRVVLLEQIYRSFRIQNNEPYHK